MFKRLFDRTKRDDAHAAAVRADGLTGETAILSILDQGAKDIAFPMLDNGYVYLAAARLSLHRSASDWAVVFEIFGFNPRSGSPDLQIASLGSRLDDHKAVEDFVTSEAYVTYRRSHPHDAMDFVWPLDDSWQDPEDLESVRQGATAVLIRGTPVEIPDRAALEGAGIDLEAPDGVAAFELCRYLGDVERESILATREERRMHVPPELEQIVVLDDWHHPDTAGGELPSQTAAFRSIARVLATGDVSAYDATEPGNTHWSNWPMGGTL